MKKVVDKLSSFPSLKITLLYAVASTLYIYSSDHIVRAFTSDATLVSELQTYKGVGFILVTSLMLYTLVNRNLNIISDYYQHMIGLKESSDRMVHTSREEYMSLFNNSPVPTWLFDPDSLRFLLVNDAACEFYGYSRAEFLQMSLRDIRSPEDLHQLDEAVATFTNDNTQTLPVIFRHRRKDGALVKVKVKVTYVIFEGRRVRLVSITDLTVEMQIQEQLRDTNARLKMASEIAGLGYWTNNLAQQRIEWSDEMYKIFEIQPQAFELKLENIRQFFYPEVQAYFENGFLSDLKDGGIREYERRIRTTSGKTKWILERLYLIHDKDGKPLQLEGIVLDISKRKMQEQHIRESNDRFKMLTKATVEAIIDWDIENHEVIWGEGFQTMLGYDLRQNDFNLWSNNIHADDRDRVLSELRCAMADPGSQHFNSEFRFMKASGEIIYVQHRGIFIRNEKGKAIRALGAMIDLTEALLRVRKIEQQDKVLKEIAWTQSHVVRAPLANLMGLISLMKNNANTGVSDEVLLSYISQSAEQLDKVIRDIVGKTRIHAEGQEPLV